MVKALGDILKGIKSSTEEPLDLDDLTIPPAKGSKEFLAKHKVQKHADRVGNGDDVYKGKTKKAEMSRHGYGEKAQKAQNEEFIDNCIHKGYTDEEILNCFEINEGMFSTLKRLITGRRKDSAVIFTSKSPSKRISYMPSVNTTDGEKMTKSLGQHMDPDAYYTPKEPVNVDSSKAEVAPVRNVIRKMSR